MTAELRIMTQQFSGKVALVTGGASGLGRRFASLINLVRAASKTACLAIEKKRITRLAH